MIAAFGIIAICCCALLVLQKTPLFGGEEPDRVWAAGTAITVFLFLSVLVFSGLGVPYPFPALTAGGVLACAGLAGRAVRRGRRVIPVSETLLLARFALLAAIYIGLIFAFGKRYVIDNVDAVAHIDMANDFLRMGLIPLANPFRYPALTSVLLGIFMGTVPFIPHFLAYQAFNVCVLFGVALAVRRASRLLGGRDSLLTDALIVTVTFTTLLMNALIFGFTSMLLGILLVLITLILGSRHVEVRSPGTLAAAALGVVGVSATYYLYTPVAFAIWYLSLVEASGFHSLAATAKEALRPAIFAKALLLVAVSLIVVYGYVPDQPVSFTGYFKAYGGGVTSSLQHLSSLGGCYVDLRFIAILVPFVLIALCLAWRERKFAVLGVAVVAAAFLAAYELQRGGAISQYYFSKFLFLASAFAFVGLAATVSAVSRHTRAGALLLLLIFVGAGVPQLLGAWKRKYFEKSAVGRVWLRSATHLAGVYRENYGKLRRDAILGKADLEAVRYLRANAAAVLDADTGYLTAAGAGHPLYHYSRVEKIPLVFMTFGIPMDVYGIYFKGTISFDQWLANPAVTHLLVVMRDKDLASFIKRAWARGLKTAFHKGNVFILSKEASPPAGGDSVAASP